MASQKNSPPEITADIIDQSSIMIFEEIFRKYLENKNYEDVKGISTKEFNTLPRERIEDFSILPSPYLNNTILPLFCLLISNQLYPNMNS